MPPSAEAWQTGNDQWRVRMSAPVSGRWSLGLDITISPDGKRIAYLVQKPDNGNYELYVRELDALESHPIPGTERPTGSPVNPFFSPDGKSIGFSMSGRGILSAAIDGRPGVKLLDPPSPGFTGGWWAADNTIIYGSGRRLQPGSSRPAVA